MAPHPHQDDHDAGTGAHDAPQSEDADALDPEEPITPIWLPLLGLGLLILVLIWVLAAPGAGQPAAGPTRAGETAAATAPPGVTTVVAPVVRVPPPARPD